jgi:hypothetical protein
MSEGAAMRLGKAVATGYAVDADERIAADDTGTPEEAPVTVTAGPERAETEETAGEQVVLRTAG